MDFRFDVMESFQEQGQEAAIQAAVLNILDDIKHCHLRFCDLEQLSDFGRAYALALMNVEEMLERVGMSLTQDMRPKED